MYLGLLLAKKTCKSRKKKKTRTKTKTKPKNKAVLTAPNLSHAVVQIFFLCKIVSIYLFFISAHSTDATIHNDNKNRHLSVHALILHSCNSRKKEKRKPKKKKKTRNWTLHSPTNTSSSSCSLSLVSLNFCCLLTFSQCSVACNSTSFPVATRVAMNAKEYM